MISSLFAAEMIFLIERSTAGLYAEYRYATSGLPLSAAIVYPVKSFVPILKKSASFARMSAIKLAAAVSIITPTWMSLSYAIPSASNSCFSSSMIAFTARSSSTHVTNGTMIRTLPKALARNNARSCGL